MKFYKVTIIESEAGWGQSVDEVRYYNENEEQVAKDYVKQFNSRNTEATAPSWYMRADGPTPVFIDDALVNMIVAKAKTTKKRIKKI